MFMKDQQHNTTFYQKLKSIAPHFVDNLKLIGDNTKECKKS